jgi:TolB-like protein/Tfp pilus assembly protein PilF
MEADETGTIERLKTLRAELVDPAISRHHGRIVKLMGDGMLVEFASVVDAVQCAVEIQRAMPDREPGTPQEQRIRYRIGINVGDIVIDGDDIFGDGVNIAARLEALAKPGGVAISGTAYDQIRSKIDFGYEDAGVVEVKNIRQPVRVYHVMPDGGARDTIAAASQSAGGGRRRVILAVALMLLVALAGGGWWWAQGRGGGTETHSGIVTSLLNKPAVAVLPFVNTSGDAEEEAFADGLTRTVIGALSRVSGLAVASGGTTFSYKGKTASPRDVGDDLNVQAVVEGSIQRSGDRSRIDVQLADARTNRVLWSNGYSISADDTSAMQAQIVKDLVTNLQAELVEGEAMRTFSSTTENAEAFEYATRLRGHYVAVTQRDNSAGIRIAKKALELDPDYTRVWVSLGWFLYQRVTEGWSTNSEADQAAARSAIERAIEIDPHLPDSYTMLSKIKHMFDRDFTASVELAQKGVELNLNNPQGWWVLGDSLYYIDEFDEALRAFKQMRRLSPRLPSRMLVNMGHSFRLSGEPEKAEAIFEEIVDMQTSDAYTAQGLLGLAMVKAELGDETEARTIVSRAIELDPRLSVRYQMNLYVVMENENTAERWHDTLSALGLPD